MKAVEHVPDLETREFILKGGNLNETEKIILNFRAEHYAFRVMKPHLIDRSDSIPVFTASGAGIPLDGGIIGEYDINIYSHIKHKHRQHMLKEYSGLTIIRRHFVHKLIIIRRTNNSSSHCVYLYVRKCVRNFFCRQSQFLLF